jgi:hypothetical protein
LRAFACSTRPRCSPAPWRPRSSGDFGAEVIKVEHPTRGDGMRGHGPSIDGHGLWWKISRNKRCVGLYLGDPDGAELLLELVRAPTCVVENFRPGTLERWGLGWDRLQEVNPACPAAGHRLRPDRPLRRPPGLRHPRRVHERLRLHDRTARRPADAAAFGLADSIAAMAGASTPSRWRCTTAMPRRDRPGDRPQPARADHDGGSGPPSPCTTSSAWCRSARATAHQQRPTEHLYRTRRPLGRDLDQRQRRSPNGSCGWSATPRSSTSPGSPQAPACRARRPARRPRRRLDRRADPRRGDGRLRRGRRRRRPGLRRVRPRRRPAGRALDMVTDVEDDDLGRMRMQNVLFRMSETPGGIRHTGRISGPTPMRCCASSVSTRAHRGPPGGASLPDRPLLRSYLYAPGSSDRILVQGARAGADAVVLDLEDAVAASQGRGPRHVAEFLRINADRPDRPELHVRVNARPPRVRPRRRPGVVDPGLRRCGCRSATTRAACACSPRSSAISSPPPPGPQQHPVYAIIESAAGLYAAKDLATAPRMARLCFGSADFLADIGARVRPTVRPRCTPGPGW